MVRHCLYRIILLPYAVSRVITLEHNNEELRNTNGCYLVTQFSSNPTNRFILSELSFLAKVAKRFLCDQIFAVEIFITHCNQNYCCLSLNHQKFFDKGLSPLFKKEAARHAVEAALHAHSIS